KNQFIESDSKHKRIDELLDEEKLVITPLSYIRGRSLVRVFFIVDEAQNLTPHEVKTIITRAGEGTKMIFTGDIFQIDHPYLDSQSNGLSYLIEKMQGQSIYAHINLEKGERSELADLASNLL
ncbi:MAG: PhoH family protein, partial [bacterium]|nr:PhoH family protein [bacterium]